ncbi:MAG: hypothetical protein B6229_07320 [Spirochaetaceae bacterium 4572_7]|nr:MAG: hypothetical protein B6229_07320 [Spirochaetaceae bacterium 4572_7]
MLRKLFIIIFITISIQSWADVGIFELQKDRMYYNDLSSESSYNQQYMDSDYILTENLSTIKNFDSFSISLFNPTIFASFNSSTPSGINDGAIWQGKGFNTQFETGVVFQSKYLNMKLIPKIWLIQNTDFKIIEPAVDSIEYGSIISGMDQYQRPGSDYYYEIDLGKSSIEIKYGIFSLEVSTDSFILGPARISPLIMSDNSAGFNHIRLGLNGLETSIGVFEFNSIMGILKESEFFDEIDDNDNILLSGYNFSYSPVFLKGFSFGFNRTLTVPEEFVSPEVAFKIYDLAISGGNIGEPYGYDKTDQRISFVFDWKFHETGLRLYGEWSKNDYSTNYELFLRTPEHASALTFGMSKTLGNFFLEFEYSDLINSRDYELGGLGIGGTFYKHHIVSQGYTNKGQLLGAGIGSGSDAQTLTLSYLKDKLTLKGYIQRVAIMKDYIYGKHYDSSDEYSGKDQYPVDRLQFDGKLGFKGMYSLDSLTLFADITADMRYAYNFEPKHYQPNLYIALGLQYNL